MRCLLIALFLMLSSFLKAQDTSSCTCTTTYKISYPKKAEQNKISGTIIVEWKVSANGLWSDPVITKSLGYGCDEEAIRVARLMINTNNLCREKCKTKNGKEEKLNQTFNFQYTDE
jgi:TonB family protein